MNIPQQNSPPLKANQAASGPKNFWSSRYYDSLYHLERRWAANMVEEHRPFVIYAGRGVGKSPTMVWIRDEVIEKRAGYQPFGDPKETHARDPEALTYLCIAGKDTKNALENLHHAANAKPRPTAVLVDDIDQILGRVKRESGTAGAIHDLLGNLRQFLPVDGDPNLLIFTATEEVHEPRFDDPDLRREEELWSGLFARIERRQLNPWSSFNWSEELHDLIQEELTPDPATEDSHLPEEVRAKLAEVVPGIVVDLGGGHPNLTGQFLDILEDFWSKEEKLRDPLEIRIVQLCTQKAGQEPMLSGYLKRYLEDRLVRSPRGLRSLRRSIQRLQAEHAEKSEELTAFSELIRIARRRNTGDDAPRDFDIRLQLTAGGLVYEDPKTLRFAVPGTLLQGEVLRYQPESPPPRVEEPQEERREPLALSASPKDPTEEGVLAVQRPDGERVQVPLDGRNWRILTALDRQRGQVMSIDDLATELGAQAAATRSALRRLREKLEEYGIGRILDNQWGKGYRLIEPS